MQALPPDGFVTSIKQMHSESPWRVCSQLSFGAFYQLVDGSHLSLGVFHQLVEVDLHFIQKKNNLR